MRASRCRGSPGSSTRRREFRTSGPECACKPPDRSQAQRQCHRGFGAKQPGAMRRQRQAPDVGSKRLPLFGYAHIPPRVHRVDRKRPGAMALGSACDGTPFLAQAGGARLKVRPKPGGSTTARGRSALALGGTRDAILWMPAVIPCRPDAAGGHAARRGRKRRPISSALRHDSGRGRRGDALRGFARTDMGRNPRRIRSRCGVSRSRPRRKSSTW